MEELIKKWEKRIKHYEKLVKAATNNYTIERLLSAIDTFNTCIDELEHISVCYHNNQRFEGAKCAFCGKRVSFDHETEKRTCCDPDLPVFLGGPEK
ncbi:MAG TPA: hypothetical protein VMW41_00195 [Candidatus Bathyarchaeia archaeon]|nr:hypothetical protein [Candidatus Bathyarchaeia archaeon]